MAIAIYLLYSKMFY